jgi:hypothetical protein
MGAARFRFRFRSRFQCAAQMIHGGSDVCATKEPPVDVFARAGLRHHCKPHHVGPVPSSTSYWAGVSTSSSPGRSIPRGRAVGRRSDAVGQAQHQHQQGRGFKVSVFARTSPCSCRRLPRAPCMGSPPRSSAEGFRRCIRSTPSARWGTASPARPGSCSRRRPDRSDSRRPCRTAPRARRHGSASPSSDSGERVRRQLERGCPVARSSPHWPGR